MKHSILALTLTGALCAPSLAQNAQTQPAAAAETNIPRPGQTIADLRLQAAANAPVLTVQDAIAMALEKNPLRSQAQANQAAAAARVDNAKAQGKPTVGLNGAVNYDRNFDQPSFGAGGGSDIFTSNGINETGGLNATIPLITGGRVKAQTRVSEAQARAAAAQRLQVEQDIVYNAAVGYLAVLRAEQLLEVADSNVAVSRERLRVANVRFNAGAAAKLEVLRAQNVLVDADLGRVSAANSVALTRANLNRQMGRPPETPLRLVSLAEVEPPKGAAAAEGTANFAFPVADLPPEQLRRIADQRRPALIAAQEQVRAAEATVDVAKAQKKPSLAASIGGTLRDPVTFLGRFALSLGLSVAQTLYDGGRAKAQIRETQSLLEQTKQGLDVQRQQVAFELEQQLLTVDAAEEKLKSVDSAVVTAREALRAAQIGYEAGVRTAVEVSDAQSALLAAQTSAVNSRFELANARAQLASSAGVLSREWQVAYEEALRKEIGRLKR